ncbi:hypothetical protein [Dactylosporangium sp. CA-092794]|uniref:hypothetical protein n=1 Tax=Dactylosporangium sp. CA-092794 TaxID=3239929 RepID=UPI003D910868
MDQDLHTLLTSVRDDAPPPRLSVDDITAAGRHLARRRKRLALLSSVSGGAVTAVAAVTAALIIAAPSGVTPQVPSGPANSVAASAGPPAFTDTQPFMTTYRGYEAGSFLVSDPDLVTTAYQQSSIDAGIALPPVPASPSTKAAKTADPVATSRIPGLLRGGILVVYRAGNFDPREFVKAERIDLRAGTGLLYYSGGTGDPAATDANRALMLKSQPQIPTLAWQYADNSWAVVYWSSWETVPRRDTLVAIADGLAPATPRPFPVGLVPSYRPKGYQLLSAGYGTDPAAGDPPIVSAVRLAPTVPRTPLTRPIDFAEYPALTLTLGRTDPKIGLAGKLDCSAPTSCTRYVDDGGVFVQGDLDGIKPTPAVSLAQVMLGLKSLDPDDMEGWPAATDVFG